MNKIYLLLLIFILQETLVGQSVSDSCHIILINCMEKEILQVPGVLFSDSVFVFSEKDKKSIENIDSMYVGSVLLIKNGLIQCKLYTVSALESDISKITDDYNLFCDADGRIKLDDSKIVFPIKTFQKKCN